MRQTRDAKTHHEAICFPTYGTNFGPVAHGWSDGAGPTRRDYQSHARGRPRQGTGNERRSHSPNRRPGAVELVTPRGGHGGEQGAKTPSADPGRQGGKGDQNTIEEDGEAMHKGEQLVTSNGDAHQMI